MRIRTMRSSSSRADWRLAVPTSFAVAVRLAKAGPQPTATPIVISKVHARATHVPKNPRQTTRRGADAAVADAVAQSRLTEATLHVPAPMTRMATLKSWMPDVPAPSTSSPTGFTRDTAAALEKVALRREIARNARTGAMTGPQAEVRGLSATARTRVTSVPTLAAGTRFL